MRRVTGFVAAAIVAVSVSAQAGDCCQPQSYCCAPKKSCFSFPKLSLPKLDLFGCFKKKECCPPVPCCTVAPAHGAPAGDPHAAPAAAPSKETAPPAPPYEEKAPAPKAPAIQKAPAAPAPTAKSA